MNFMCDGFCVLRGALTRTLFWKTLGRLGAFLLVIALVVTLFPIAPNPLFPRGSSARAATETVRTYASDCATPQSTFNVGDTVCVIATGTLLPDQRRFVWADPDGTISKLAASFVSSDPATDSFTIPMTAGEGTWKVQTIDGDGSGIAVATFAVRNPSTPAAGLQVVKVGPSQISTSTNNISYTLAVFNQGPDVAENVVLTDSAPTNLALISSTQNSGPTFTCSTGTCTIASLPANSKATFTFLFSVSGGLAAGDTISNSATISSSTEDPHASDNSSTAVTTVTGPLSCTISCPSNITVDIDAGQCGAIVTFPNAVGSGNCGTLTATPASGSFFPIGTTPVTVVSDTGDFCRFTVTVRDPRPPTQPVITCPSNIAVTEDRPDLGYATVTFPTPTATGNCVTVTTYPESGSIFTIGTTTVTATATDSAGNTATCTFLVTVNPAGGTACTLTCPANITVPVTPGQCGAVVTYPPATTSGTCGTLTYSVPSGSLFPVGDTAVLVTSSTGQSCSFTVRVTDAVQPTITTCASSKTIAADANCEAVIPNLTGEVVATDNSGCPVAVSQSPAAGTVVGLGVTVVTLTAVDGAGNEATCTAPVNVVDNMAPVIMCPANVSATLPLGGTATSMVVNYPAPTATDNCSIPSVSSSPASGSVFTVGSTTITGTATDSVGNTSTCTFAVSVLYNFSGFFQPVGNLPVLNQVTAGKAIPVKFSLSGNKGLNIFAPGYPAVVPIECSTRDPIAEVQETVAAGGSSLNYDAATDQYVYVWKTDASWAGTCRQLVVRLNDGTEHRANFQFK